MSKANSKKNPVAVMMGYLSAERMTPAQRKRRAQTAARARWTAYRNKKGSGAPPASEVSS